MLYKVETRLRSNSNNLELQEAGNACWVLHSSHLTDSNESRIFLRKTHESNRVGQTFRCNISLQDIRQNIIIKKDECRLLIKVRLKRLKSAANWAFALLCSFVIVLLVFLHLLVRHRLYSLSRSRLWEPS